MSENANIAEQRANREKSDISDAIKRAGLNQKCIKSAAENYTFFGGC